MVDAYQQGHTAESIHVGGWASVVHTEIDGMGSEWLGSEVDFRCNYILLTSEPVHIQSQHGGQYLDQV